ncbi:MAG: hypothetical protein HOM65_15620 [Verrucomicrobia bacterium]|nr:hypothetical protein [Verrucomicrobiota bacterium]
MKIFFPPFYGMARYFVLVVSLAFYINVGSLLAAPMPANIKEQLNRLVGTWETRTRIADREIIEKVTVEWGAAGTTLMFHGEGENFATEGQTTRFSGIFGWDEQGQIVRECGFDNRGGTFFANHQITPNSWSDEVTATSVLANGKAVHEVFNRTFRFESSDLWSLESKNRLINGQKGVVTIFKRVAHVGQVNLDPGCPWEWMLGDWTVERSDGTTAKVHWLKPRSDVDSVVGKWLESDGNEFNELVGWESDRGHLIANGYGVKGSYFTVRFNKVSRDEMSGFLRSRDMQGVSQMSVVHLNRISATEVRSKLIMSDGSMISESFLKSK